MAGAGGAPGGQGAPLRPGGAARGLPPLDRCSRKARRRPRSSRLREATERREAAGRRPPPRACDTTAERAARAGVLGVYNQPAKDECLQCPCRTTRRRGPRGRRDTAWRRGRGARRGTRQVPGRQGESPREPLRHCLALTLWPVQPARAAGRGTAVRRSARGAVYAVVRPGRSRRLDLVLIPVRCTRRLSSPRRRLGRNARRSPRAPASRPEARSGAPSGLGRSRASRLPRLAWALLRWASPL